MVVSLLNSSSGPLSYDTSLFASSSFTNFLKSKSMCPRASLSSFMAVDLLVLFSNLTGVMLLLLGESDASRSEYLREGPFLGEFYRILNIFALSRSPDALTASLAV